MKNSNAPTREELFKLVWSAPVTKVARGMGVSDVALAKRCRREGVPLPPRGYWAKVASGQAPNKPALTPKVARRSITSAITEPVDKRRPSAPPAANPAIRLSSKGRNLLDRKDRMESFQCKIDRFERKYWFGVNQILRRSEPKSWSEHDALRLFGTVVSNTTKPYGKLEMWLVPMHVPRDKIPVGLDSIGMARAERRRKGWLICSAHVPTDAFYGLCDSIARHEFVEMVVEVRNLRYGQGSTSHIYFHARANDEEFERS